MDLYLLHSPSYYDFTKDHIISGSGVAGVPTTSFFEMHPIGLISLAEVLQKNHYKARIVNLALKMIRKKRFDLEKYIKNLDAVAYGFDLHWMIHAQGSLKIAKIVKKHHPDSSIIFGGFTASYFHKELMQDYPFIDFIIRGDSAEYPLLKLMDSLIFRKKKENIPNLVWRDNKKIRINQFNHIPKNIDFNGINFPKIYFKMFIDSCDLDIFSYLPTLYFLKKPVIPILFSKGCTYNCINCGGSRYANKIISNRDSIAKKTAKDVAEEIINVSQSFDFPMRLIGDLRICGRKFCDKLFYHLRGVEVDNPVTFELFTPAPKHYLKRIGKIFNRVSIEISPESGNQDVRIFQGRPFTNRGIFDMMKNFDMLKEYIYIMWFQTGNAMDSEKSFQETLNFCEKTLDIDTKNTHPFLSPLAPYIDPGSIAFDYPEKFGYKITRPTLRSQIKGFNQPLWKYYLNYETRNLSTDQIISYTYEYVKKLEKLKFQRNILTEVQYLESVKILEFLERLINLTDRIWQQGGREDVNIFLKKMNFDKTGLNIKSKLTRVLFPELSKFDFIRNFIKFSSHTIKRNL